LSSCTTGGLSRRAQLHGVRSYYIACIIHESKEPCITKILIVWDQEYSRSFLSCIYSALLVPINKFCWFCIPRLSKRVCNLFIIYFYAFTISFRVVLSHQWEHQTPPLLMVRILPATERPTPFRTYTKMSYSYTTFLNIWKHRRCLPTSKRPKSQSYSSFLSFLPVAFWYLWSELLIRRAVGYNFLVQKTADQRQTERHDVGSYNSDHDIDTNLAQRCSQTVCIFHY
jgi:hypothetical protein